MRQPFQRGFLSGRAKCPVDRVFLTFGSGYYPARQKSVSGSRSKATRPAQSVATPVLMANATARFCELDSSEAYHLCDSLRRNPEFNLHADARDVGFRFNVGWPRIAVMGRFRTSHSGALGTSRGWEGLIIVKSVTFGKLPTMV